MTTEFERDREERQAIRRETRPALIMGMVTLISVGIYTLLARFISFDPFLSAKTRETVYGIGVLVIVLIMITILAVRKTVYYSSRMVREVETVAQILRRWNTIDIVLIAVSEIIPLVGLALTWLGLPFARTWFIFLVSALLLIILMPMSIKVRGKLMILRQQHPDLNV